MHTVVVVAPWSWRCRAPLRSTSAPPSKVFGRVALPQGRPASRVPVRAGEPVYTAGRLRIATDHGVGALAGAHTIVIPGRNGRHGGNTAGGMNPWLRICADVMKK